MKRSRVVLVGIAVIAVTMALSFLLFPLEPTLVTHAQTPVTAPSALPGTGVGGTMDGGIGLAAWIGLVVAGAATLAVAMFLATRGFKVRG